MTKSISILGTEYELKYPIQSLIQIESETDKSIFALYDSLDRITILMCILKNGLFLHDERITNESFNKILDNMYPDEFASIINIVIDEFRGSFEVKKGVKRDIKNQ